MRIKKLIRSIVTVIVLIATSIVSLTGCSDSTVNSTDSIVPEETTIETTETKIFEETSVDVSETEDINSITMEDFDMEAFSQSYMDRGFDVQLRDSSFMKGSPYEDTFIDGFFATFSSQEKPEIKENGDKVLISVTAMRFNSYNVAQEFYEVCLKGFNEKCDLNRETETGNGRITDITTDETEDMITIKAVVEYYNSYESITWYKKSNVIFVESFADYSKYDN